MVHAESEARVDLDRRLWKLAFQHRDAALLPLLWRIVGAAVRLDHRRDGQERRAEALHAREVLVAGALVDAGLATELGRHRLDAHAVRLDPAIAAAFADALIDDHAL